MSEMKASNVISFYQAMEELAIEIWLDGGWGVDALLGEQTRPHGDLDIVIQEKDVPSALDFLTHRGFRQLERDDTCAWNFVMDDGTGKEIDFHVIVFDQDGNGVYGPPEYGAAYPAPALRGLGRVNGHRVKCTTADYQILSHQGYAFDETDVRDVRALAERFGLEIPKLYRAHGKGQARPYPVSTP